MKRPLGIETRDSLLPSHVARTTWRGLQSQFANVRKRSNYFRVFRGRPYASSRLFRMWGVTLVDRRKLRSLRAEWRGCRRNLFFGKNREGSPHLLTENRVFPFAFSPKRG